MKAFLIDTPNKQVVQVTYDGHYRSIYKHIRAEMFGVVTIADINRTTVDVFVDEEGLINDNPHGWFAVAGTGRQPYRGYGLVLGCNDQGETVEPPVTLKWVQRKIIFLPEVATA